LTNGTTAPRVDITVTLPNTITSRLGTGTTKIPSDALLLVDDPQPAAGNSSIDPVLNGFGNSAAQVVCTDTTDDAQANTCAAFAETVTSMGNVNYTVTSSTAANPPTTGAPNVYQGLVSGKSVTFYDVPVIAPGTTSARTFRITNIRIDASAAAAGPVTASLTIANTPNQTVNAGGLFGSVPTTTTVGVVAPGLLSSSTKWTAATPGLTNCAALSFSYAGTVSFSENFGSAFKTRQVPNVAAPAQYSAQNGGALTQGIPQAYLSESGIEVAGVPNLPGGTTAGLADFGTRLKAKFSNIPTNARVFVSFTNVEGATSANVGTQNTNLFPANGPDAATVGSTASTSFAELISYGGTTVEDTADGAAAPVVSGATLKFGSATSGAIPTGMPYVELTVNTSTQTATAVWEVLNTSPTAPETFTFDVFVTQAASGNTGTATVNLSYAPTGSTTTKIPSFSDTSGSGTSSFVIGGCTTVLIFPYVTSAAGFATGLAVSNTTTDALGTTPQAGACTLNLYGIDPTTGNPPTTTTLPASDAAGKPFPAAGVPSGQTAQWLITGSAPSPFTGYAIATCNFQYAHGFAFVYAPALSAAMGYLPLVAPSSTGRSAGSQAEQLNN